MRLVPGKGSPIDAGNRPKLDGQDVIAAEYVEAFVTGFESVYRLIEAHRDQFQALLDRFEEDAVRYVARATSVYVRLLKACHHPDRLRNALDRDQMLDHLWLGAAGRPEFIRLIPAELRDLHAGDIPMFTARPNSRDVWLSDGERIPDFFEQSSMSIVREGLNHLGDEDLARQVSLIRTAIASGAEGESPRTHSPLRASSRQTIEMARAVGDRLCRQVLENESCANWIGITPVGSSERAASLQPLDASLYSGLSGCSFFLAYLSAATGDKSYEQIARKAVTLVRRLLDRGRAAGAPMQNVGAFAGSGGIIYALAHLAALWDDPSLIGEAQALAAEMPALIESDTTLDVGGGSAGAIVALAVLNKVSASASLLETAMRCGDRLLQQQQAQQTGAAWKTAIESERPLTGFCHGAAGIAWALLKLAAWSGQQRFREAAELAIAYERSTFVAEKSNWPDFRTAEPGFMTAWCHGAPGIALARADNLQYMDDHETREEIRIALLTTVASGFGGSHCLCHGELGNLDILFHAAQGIDVSHLASGTLKTIADQGCLCGTQNLLEAPGLMIGIAGIGYGLLRMAVPEQVPSVLVLSPPQI
jgi:type 2 lantibiotic biosynthesis protein LanM